MKTVRVKKYKCPYCELRASRTDLVEHIDTDHQVFIPENHTAARIVFNIANKKTEGRCIVCGRISPWNESANRYDRLCTRKQCKEEYANRVNSSIVKVHGKSREDFLNDVEHQNKMLSGRSLSGEYKFSDGGIRTYVGSYERNLLEFMDKVLEIPSKDIVTPGPTIEYVFDKDTHKWITDLLYIPYNLVFDVKHGGSNKNTHPGMAVNNAKQIAKEEAITKLGEFNYIRLTDNDFSQLIEIFMEMKEKALNHIDDATIRIFEGAMIGTIASKDDPVPYIVGYGNPDTGKIDGYGIVKNILTPTLFVQDGDLDFKAMDSNFLSDKKAIFYKILQPFLDKNFDDIAKGIAEAKEESIHPVLSYLFETESIDELILSEKVVPIYSCTNIVNYEDKLAEQFDISNEPDDAFIFENAVLDEYVLESITDKLYGYKNLIIDESYNGYVVKNTKNGHRSIKYKSIEDIPNVVLNLLNRGY